MKALETVDAKCLAAAGQIMTGFALLVGTRKKYCKVHN